MFDDESLPSKYTRLGIEYKKLRERHRFAKENLRDSANQVKLLESRFSDQSIHTRNLEHEKESLIFRNQYLVKQASFLQNQLDSRNIHGRSASNVDTAYQDSSSEALQKALAECNSLHKELISQSSKFLSRVAALEAECRVKQNSRPSRSSAIQTESNPIDRSNSSSLDGLSYNESSKEKDADFVLTGSSSMVSTSSQPESTLEFCSSSSRSPSTNHRRPSKSKSDQIPFLVYSRSASMPGPSAPATSNDENLSTREQLLLFRIGRLERQLAEASLKHHIESRRSQLALSASYNASTLKGGKHINSEEGNAFFFVTPNSSRTNVELSSQESLSPAAIDSTQPHDKLLSEFLEAQLTDRNRELLVYAGRAAAASDEIRNLHELLVSARREVDHLQATCNTSRTKISNLEEELESTKMRTAQQLSEMAAHLATLTDEIHFLRNNRPPCTTTPVESNGKQHSSVAHELSKSSTVTSLTGKTHDSVSSFFASLLR